VRHFPRQLRRQRLGSGHRLPHAQRTGCYEQQRRHSALPGRGGGQGRGLQQVSSDNQNACKTLHWFAVVKLASSSMKGQVLAVMSMKVAVFWDAALRILVEIDRTFRRRLLPPSSGCNIPGDSHFRCKQSGCLVIYIITASCSTDLALP
jgi:hypothetical protein